MKSQGRPQPPKSKAQPAQAKTQPAQSKAQPAKAAAVKGRAVKAVAKSSSTKAPAKTQAARAKAQPTKAQPTKAQPAKTQPTKAQAVKPQTATGNAHPAPAKPPAPKASSGRLGAPRSAPDQKPVAVKAPPKPTKERMAFFEKQRQLLLEERDQYLRSADALKAQADSLALEHEPGDVQFDEEGGEGGTSNIDREMDLVLSAQARSAAAEIDRALAKIEAGTYGYCEQCGDPIPEARLQALPYAALCVTCKSGGLSSRR
ncbi:MAG TPA: TraR/DksA C4-type zinc finger protein [Acidimicrobiales bacterium]|nr:TraR/DksA C4-type zinc finger protein [Acidimicrobiales bacterium]